jgi:hypothetical protein
VVPTFYFNLSDSCPDSDGHHFENVSVAKCEAAKMLGKILCDESEGFWDNAAWTLTVTDETRLTLFQLHIMGTEAAAIGGSRPAERSAA